MKQRFTYAIFILLICCLLPSCQTTLMEMLTPKASPEQTASILEKAEKVQFKSPKKLRKSKTKIVKLKKGQWVTTLTKYKSSGNDVVLTTTKVIDIKGNSVVLETERYSAIDDGIRDITQMTIENYPVKGKIGYTQSEYDNSVKNIKITKIVNKKGDEPASEVPQQALAMSQGLAKNISAGSIRTGALNKAPISSNYVKSSRCYVYDFNVEAMGMTVTGEVTAHSAIPINGLVKLENEQMTEETIAFGLSGAKSAL